MSKLAYVEFLKGFERYENAEKITDDYIEKKIQHHYQPRHVRQRQTHSFHKHPR